MKWIPLILTPIAASNTFGLFNYLLNLSGIILEEQKIIRGVIVIVAVGIAIATNRKNNIGVILTIIIFSLGIISSLWGAFLGFNQNSNVAFGLAVLWLVLFSLSIVIVKNTYLKRK